MRTLRRPMFRVGGKSEVGNDGIMSGLVDREELQAGTPLQNVNATFDPFYQTPDMDQLRAFQSIGMGNPFRAEKDMAGRFANIFSLRPADPKKDIVKNIVESAPIVQKKEAAETALSTQEQLRPYQKYFSGNLEDVLKQTTPKVEVSDEDTSQITTKDTAGSNVVTQAEKNAILKARAEEFEELLNPGARKRVINNALAAASAQFGKSTGNTMQDIANAITAAAGATSEIDKTKQKAAELAIGESIQKGIAKEKYKPGNYEFLVQLKETDPETYRELIKSKDTDQDDIISLAKNYTGPTAVPKAIGDLYQLKADGANAKDYGGTLPVKLDPKSKTNIPDFNKMEAGKIYYSYTDKNFYKIGESGEPEVTSKPSYLK